MKTFQSGLATFFAMVITLTAPAQTTGVFKFESADLMYVLEAYQSMTGRQLVITSNVRQAKITLQSQGPTTAQEAARMIERALIDQAGVVITPLDSGRVFRYFRRCPGKAGDGELVEKYAANARV
jgi:type II secretory pathway component GspD/PulD (secretin)